MNYFLSFRDKTREKQRQEKLKAFQESGKMPNKKRKMKAKSEPWSKQKEKRERKVRRREIKDLKRKRKEARLDDDDIDDLNSDVRLMKKLKKGKVHVLNMYRKIMTSTVTCIPSCRSSYKMRCLSD